LAWLCQQPYKGTYAASARLYRDAFTSQSRLAADLRTGLRDNAARAAALVGCGQGKDAAGLDDKERAAWRRQALEWLRADLAFWAREGEKPDPKAWALVGQKMQHWLKDRDLAGVRDPEALAKLPEAERAEWRKLWTKVEALLQRSQPKK
jgi:hypothetical protein